MFLVKSLLIFILAVHKHLLCYRREVDGGDNELDVLGLIVNRSLLRLRKIQPGAPYSTLKSPVYRGEGPCRVVGEGIELPCENYDVYD